MVKRILKSFKSILFADPKLLYKEERHLLNKPFYFPGTNGKGVLLIHGWTSTPYEVRRLGTFLHEAGYTVYGPQLKGHGTVPRDLENVKWSAWLNDAREGYEKLKSECDEIFVGGTSIGASIAILLANEKKDIAGLILMATPYKLKFEKIAFFLAEALRGVKTYNKKYYPPTFGVSTSITRLISYQTYPIKSAIESFYLIKRVRESLKNVFQPCLLMQSANDHLVSKNSIKHIYDEISSKEKKMKYIRRAYHTFISDIKNEKVFEDILTFIKKNENRNLHQ